MQIENTKQRLKVTVNPLLANYDIDRIGVGHILMVVRNRANVPL